MNQLISTFQSQQGQFWQALLEHIQISLISIFIAILISIPLALLLRRLPKIAEPADIYQHPANDFVKTFFKEYRQNLSTVSVENLLLTELSVNPEAQEVADNTAISEIINRLSDKEVLKYKGKSISSDDIICYIAGGDK